MCVERGVARRAGQRFVFDVWNVLVRLGVAILFREAKVDQVARRRTLPAAHEEIVGLDVAVNEVFAVQVLEPRELGATESIS